MVDIPDAINEKYIEFADAFIDSIFGKQCRLHYPPLQEECVNCVFDQIGQKSANRYKHGGPAPFSFGVCPSCGGSGFRDSVGGTETIRMRVYDDPKTFVKITNVVVPDGAIQVIGYLTDMPKFLQANEIAVGIENEGYGIPATIYTRGSKPHPYGLMSDRYFIAFLHKA